MITLASWHEPAKWRGEVWNAALGKMVMNGVEVQRIRVLQPTWDVVRGVKSGIVSPEQYTTAYRALLARRMPALRTWLAMLDPAQDITILCFCHEGTFCHRQLIAQILARHRPDINVMLR